MTESSTTILRRLLDERGVEWTQGMAWNVTVINGDWLVIEDIDFGTLSVSTTTYRLTPEQAIAATLGRGECEVETTENWLPAEQYHRCKHCGAFFAVMDASGDIPPCVCPNCGKAVKR